MNYIFSAYISQNKSTLLQRKIISYVNQNLDFSLSELKIIFVPSSSTRILWPLEEQRILAQVKHDQNGDKTTSLEGCYEIRDTIIGTRKVYNKS